jgi:hypothetical protein
MTANENVTDKPGRRHWMRAFLILFAIMIVVPRIAQFL